MSPRQSQNLTIRYLDRFLLTAVVMAGRRIEPGGTWGTVWTLGILLWFFLSWLDWGRSLERSPVSRILWRIYATVFGGVFSCFCFMAFLDSSLLDGSLWEKIQGNLYVTTVVVAAFLLPMLIGFRLFAPFFVSGDPGFENFRANGGHVFWDGPCMSQLFNPDSSITRQTGRGEPIYTSFVPPPDWESQCAKCGARVQSKTPTCWHCGSNLRW